MTKVLTARRASTEAASASAARARAKALHGYSVGEERGGDGKFRGDPRILDAQRKGAGNLT